MIKFAVIGMGHIGKRHAAIIRNNPDTELVAVCDILPKEALGLDALQEPFFSSIDALLQADIEVDVVNICTPNGLHALHAVKALEAGKHVVLEKPIALRRVDAEKILYTSLKMSRHVFSVMQNRYSPPSKWLKELVDNKVLGAIYMVKLDCYWNRDERYYQQEGWHGTADLDGGTLFTQFSHFIDIMYWLFGDITNITGKFADYNHAVLTDFEDSGVVSFNFVEGNAIGAINYSTAIWNANFESAITVIGENGTVKVAGQYMSDVVYCHIKDYEMPLLEPSNPPNDYGIYKGSAQNHHYVIENVVEKLKGTGDIKTNLLEGLKVVDIIERIYEVRDQQWKK